MVLYWLAWVTVRLLATVLCRLHVSGARHIPKTGGVLIAADHASYLDIPILGCGMFRRAWFMGRTDLFGAPIDFSALMKELDSESKKKELYQRISQEIMGRIAELGGV